jgi:hypothetical protein
MIKTQRKITFLSLLIGSTDNNNILRLKNRPTIEGDFDAGRIKTIDYTVSLPNVDNETTWLEARELEVSIFNKFCFRA